MKTPQEGEHVNLLDFPAPLLHEKDGGRYLGTGHLVITKDPDSDWVNVGTYRIMSQDQQHRRNLYRSGQARLHS